jgi:hypothetical protein
MWDTPFPRVACGDAWAGIYNAFGVEKLAWHEKSRK